MSRSNVSRPIMARLIDNVSSLRLVWDMKAWIQCFKMKAVTVRTPPTKVYHPFHCSALSKHGNPMKKRITIVSGWIRNILIHLPSFIEIIFDRRLKLLESCVGGLVPSVWTVQGGYQQIMVFWTRFFRVAEWCAHFRGHTARYVVLLDINNVPHYEATQRGIGVRTTPFVDQLSNHA